MSTCLDHSCIIDILIMVTLFNMKENKYDDAIYPCCLRVEIKDLNSTFEVSVDELANESDT